MANSENATFIPDKQGIGTGPLLASVGGLIIVLLVVVPFVVFMIL